MTGENGHPVTPDWVCEARPCPVFQIADRLRVDDLALPPLVELGEN